MASFALGFLKLPSKIRADLAKARTDLANELISVKEFSSKLQALDQIIKAAEQRIRPESTGDKEK